MYLLINTAKTDLITLALIELKGQDDFFWHHKSIEAPRQQSEKLLLNIERLLKNNKASLKKLNGVIVITGPGSFTSLRIGLASANTLGYVLNIPVIGISLKELKRENDLLEMVKKGIKKLKKQKSFKIVLPYYGQEPNITKPKA